MGTDVQRSLRLVNLCKAKCSSGLKGCVGQFGEMKPNSQVLLFKGISFKVLAPSCLVNT